MTSPDRLAAELRERNVEKQDFYWRYDDLLEEAAATLTRLQSERDALKHDIERHVRIAAEEAEARGVAERELATVRRDALIDAERACMKMRDPFDGGPEKEHYDACAAAIRCLHREV